MSQSPAICEVQLATDALWPHQPNDPCVRRLPKVEPRASKRNALLINVTGIEDKYAKTNERNRLDDVRDDRR